MALLGINEYIHNKKIDSTNRVLPVHLYVGETLSVFLSYHYYVSSLLLCELMDNLPPVLSAYAYMIVRGVFDKLWVIV